MVKSTKTNKKINKPYIIIAIVVVLIIAAGTGLLFHIHKTNTAKKTVTGKGVVRPVNSVDYSPGTAGDNAASEARKSSSSPSSNTTTGASGSSQSGSVKVSILNSVQVNSGGTQVLHVGNLVSGATSGTCTLTLSQSGQASIIKNSQVILNAGNYYCGSWNVPVSEFPAGGSWNVGLSVTSNGSTGSDSSTVVIQK